MKNKAAGCPGNAGTDSFAGYANTRQINQVDLLKGLAIIAVILIHTLSILTLSFIGAPYWLWQAVPVFLLLAAFTGALSYCRLKGNSIRDFYNPGILLRRFKRILLPFTIIWVLESITILYILPADSSVHTAFSQMFQAGIPEIAINYLTGGVGLGNYFIPLILQQILVLPLFYWLAVRLSPDRMLVIAFVSSIVIELGMLALAVPQALYADCYVRYMMLGAFGVWLVFQQRKIALWVKVAGLLSALYITAVFYFNVHLWVPDTLNGFFNTLSFFWTLLLVLAGLLYLSPQSVTLQSRIVRQLGRASWHIFLVQMAFFGLFNEALLPAVRAVAKGDPGTFLLSQLAWSFSCLIICLPLGYAFYLAEERARSWWKLSRSAGPQNS